MRVQDLVRVARAIRHQLLRYAAADGPAGLWFVVCGLWFVNSGLKREVLV